MQAHFLYQLALSAALRATFQAIGTLVSRSSSFSPATFTWKVRVAFLQLTNLRLLFPQLIGTLQGLLNRINEILIPERLGQKFHSPRFHRFDRHWDVPDRAQSSIRMSRRLRSGCT